jgi:hypothetical protein
MPANDPRNVLPDWFMELGAGEGLVVSTSGVNIGVTTAWTWMEV